MSSAVRRRILTAVVVLLFLATSAGSWLYIAATRPAAVRERLAALTGAQVEIEGVERLWWPIGLRVRGLSLRAAGWTAAAAQAEVHLAFLPLLRGEIRPGWLALSDVRLELGEDAARPDRGPALPLDADWEIHHLQLAMPVGGELRDVFYLDRAVLAARGGRSQIELVGGQSAEENASVRIEGEMNRWQPPALPDLRVQMQILGFPAQPLLGALTGDLRVLRTATLVGNLSVVSEAQDLNASGTLRATTPQGHELLSVFVSGGGRPDRLSVQSFTGQVVGNAVEATAESVSTAEGRRTEATFRLPDARLQDDTLDLLHEALGREVLGVADNLRGPFSAEGRYLAAAAGESVSGDLRLGGLTYRGPGLPTLEDIRGRLRLDGPRIEFVDVTGRLFDVPVRLGGQVRGEALALRLDTGDIPLAELPLPLGEDARVANLQGGVRVGVDIGGEVYRPELSGVATLTEAGFNYQGVAIRGLSGEASFNPEEVRFESLFGRAGNCPFELTGGLGLPRWQETVGVRLSAPECPLRQLLQLATQAGFGSLPGVRPEELDGAAALTLDYREQRWHAEIAVEDGRWGPDWLSLPLTQISARIEADPEGVGINRFLAQMGDSSASLQGGIRLAGNRPANWTLTVDSRFESHDAEQLLHGGGTHWLHFIGPVTGSARLGGSPEEGTSVTARLETPLRVSAEEVDSDSVNGAAPTQLELEGRYQDGRFQVERLVARVGSTEISGNGTVSPASEPRIALNLRVPPGSAVTDLMSFVRVPALASLEGTMAADVAVERGGDRLDWRGTVELEEIRVPALFTEPVTLRGRLELAGDTIEVREMEVAQPNGTFTISGVVRPGAESELQVRGSWANLDGLLGQLPQGTRLPSRHQALARYPFRASLALDQVQFLGLLISGVEGELVQRGGEFALEVPRFGLGRGLGSLTVRPEPDSDDVHTRLELEGAALESLLVDLLKQDATVRGPISLTADLTGPLAGKQDFLRESEGVVQFRIGHGRIQRGTLPERLFALAVLLRENIYGFGLQWLARLGKPPNLRRFEEWTGTIELRDGKARVADSYLASKIYDLHLSGELDLSSGAFQLHGDGHFHPAWQFDISIKAVVGLFERLFRLARGRRGHAFEFDVGGELGGRKSVQNFRFRD